MTELAANVAGLRAAAKGAEDQLHRVSGLAWQVHFTFLEEGDSCPGTKEEQVALGNALEVARAECARIGRNYTLFTRQLRQALVDLVDAGLRLPRVGEIWGPEEGRDTFCVVHVTDEVMGRMIGTGEIKIFPFERFAPGMDFVRIGGIAEEEIEEDLRAMPATTFGVVNGGAEGVES
jgi:hypothetical protein